MRARGQGVRQEDGDRAREMADAHKVRLVHENWDVCLEINGGGICRLTWASSQGKRCGCESELRAARWVGSTSAWVNTGVA